MKRKPVRHAVIDALGTVSRCRRALLLTPLLIGLSMFSTRLTQAADKPIVIKFSHVAATGTPKSDAIEHFKRVAERNTQGRVRVDVYPNSTLYKDKEELEALQMGAVQMLAPTLSKFGPLGIREFEVFDLPFLFDDRAALRRVTEGPIGQRLFGILETRGVRGLAYWDSGFKMMSANRPIRVPADMRGLKVRIQGSKVIDEQMRSLGANPQVMSFSEMTQALQSGVVDGAENPPLNFYSQKVFEVQKHLTVTNHGYLGFAVIANKRFWDGLSPDLRAALEAALAEATQMNNSQAERESAEAMRAIVKTGKTTVYQPTPQEMAQWRQALIPVHKKMEERIGKDLLDAVTKALGK